MNAVSRSKEFLRIKSLPRREWQTDERLPEIIEVLTEHLKTPKGAMTLWPEQAVALNECYDCGGLFGPIAVGKGKALVSILAPVAMEAERPLLFVPASLRDQTLLKVIPEMKKHWRLHPNLEVRGSSELSLAHKADMLEELKPDLIVIDECHQFKNRKAARTRRLSRYLYEHPEVSVVALSGTMTRKSLRDYHQIALWALGEGTPLPETWNELQDWADALDVGIPAQDRVAPGALKEFCENGETIREAFGKRLYQTPGVVASGETELGTSLRLSPWGVSPPKKIEKALKAMRKTWTTPGGEEFTEVVDLWRHARSVALGFYYRWDPAPPKEWVDARREWKIYVREILARAKKIDSELQVWNLCAANEQLRKDHPWHRWRALKDTFEVNSVPIWVDDFAAVEAAVWLLEQEGICWVEHIAFGEKVAELAGVPYFGGGAKASREILDIEGPIVASMAAHSEGKNLQRYNKMLIASPPSSGKRWEQTLARLHRPGQEADTVAVDVAMFCNEHKQAFSKALMEAKYIQDSFGSRQKLLYADIVF
jgi:hypothetical protein